jgi:hypothetical protein
MDLHHSILSNQDSVLEPYYHTDDSNLKSLPWLNLEGFLVYGGKGKTNSWTSKSNPRIILG